MTSKRPIGIDLFAGAGGLSLGFEQAGFDIVAAVEIDPVHCAVHEYNFPLCKTICRSVADIKGAEIRTNAGIGTKDIDVVFGGPPCQGFSLIGKRSLDDPRNDLVHHYVRLVRELKPKYFVFENVKGLTLGKHRQFLDEVIQMLSKDYKVIPYKVLNAADYSVPQDRRRLFLMGARKDLALPKYPEATGQTTTQEAIDDIPDAEKFSVLIDSDSVSAKFGKPSNYAKALRELGTKSLHLGYNRQYDPNMLTSSMRADHTKLSRKRFAKAICGQAEPISRFHKLNPKGVCNTLRAGTNTDHGAFTSPRPIHYRYHRCITVREAARIHSYPDWFRFHVTKWHGFRQIGNSVPPLLGRAVAGEIIKALQLKLSPPKHTLKLGNPHLLSMTLAQASAYYGVSSSVIGKRDRNYAKEATHERRAA